MPSNPFEALVPGGSSASGNPFDSLVPPPDTTGDTMRGIKVSLGQTGPILKGLVGLAGATAENTFGKGGVSTAVKNWGLDGYNEGMQKLQPLQRDTDELTTAWGKAKQGDIGALVDWAQYGLGYAIGQGGEALAASLIGGAIGAAAGGGALSPVIGAGGAITGLVAKGAVKEAAQSMIEKAVVREANALMTASAGKAAGKLTAEQAVKQATKNVASNIGSTSALLAYGGAQELGSIYPEAEAEARKNGRELDGYDLARVWGAGLAAGGIEGLTDKLGVNLALGKLKFPGSTSRLGNAAKIGAGGVVVEGATEAAQTAIERVGARQEVLSDEGIKDIINSAGLGAIGGGAIGGAAGLLHGPQPVTAEQPPVEPPTAVAKADAAMGRLAGAATIDDAINAFSDAHVPVGETIEGRVQAVRDELSNRAVMDALRTKYGDDSASQFLNSLNQAGNPNVPEAVRDKHLTAIETMLFELNARREPDAALALEGLPDTAALGYDGAPPQIGMGSTPTGAYRVGPDGVAAPETAADVTAGEQPAPITDEPQAPQGGVPGSGVMVGDGTLTPGVSRRETAPQTAMQIAMQAARAKLDAGKAAKGWRRFSDDTGTLGVPRSEMPQIKAEHRGAMTNFINARGVTHETVEVPATSLTPTQAEFSPQKVRKALDFEGGDRSILISSDGYILDGHHQWLAKVRKGEPVKAIRFDAPIRDLIALAHEFPSSTTAQGATNGAQQPVAPNGAEPSAGGVGPRVDDERGAGDSASQPAGLGQPTAAASVAGGAEAVPAGVPAAGARALSLRERADAMRAKNAVPAQAAPPEQQALTSGRVAGAGPAASWVIREKATGKVIAETFDRKKVDALNTEKYEAVPIAQHLASLNARKAPEDAPQTPATHAAPAEKPAKPEKPRAFKSRKNAERERDRLGNEHKLQKIKGGYILRRKTDKEMAAEARAGRRFASGAASGLRRSLLATIAAGGGLNISERPDTIGEGNRNVGGRMVFTRAGKTINQWAETLAHSGFIPPSEVESDDGVRWLQEAIGEEFAGRREHFAMDDEARMEEAARASQGEEPAPDDDPFGPLSDFDLEELSADGYAAASPEVQAAAEQLLAEAESHGIDTEAIREDAAIQTEGLTDDEYHAEVQRLAREALAAARGNAGRSDASAARGSDQDRSEVAGEEGSAREGLTLETQDAKSLREKTEREAAAKAADAKQKADEQRRLEREAIERETRDRARQDASAENFVLGQDANDALAGQGSIFDVPAEAVAPLSKNDREVEAGDDEVSESSLLDADASSVLVKETVRERPTKRQNASPYARFAAGEYVISVQQFPHGPGAVLHVVRHVGDIRSVERAPNEMLEDPAFSSLNDKARDLFARERAGQSSIFDAAPQAEPEAARLEREGWSRQESTRPAAEHRKTETAKNAEARYADARRLGREASERGEPRDPPQAFTSVEKQVWRAGWDAGKATKLAPQVEPKTPRAKADSQPAPDGETAARKSEAAAPARQVERDERDRSGLDAADRRRRDLDAAADELAGQIANDMLDGQYATPADRSEIAPGLRHFAELGSVPADDLRQEVLKRILADERLTKRQTKQIVDALDPTRKSKQVTAAPDKLEDAGQKIGGSRKDKWAQRGLIAADLDEMSESEGAQLVTKANVWKPDYAGMVANGATPQAAALVKVIFDSLAAKPRANTPQGRRDYVTAMQAVRSVYGAVKTEADATNAVHKLRDALGLNARLDGSPAAQQDARRVLFSVYKGRSDPFVIFYNEKRRASKLVEAGFPGVIEPWTRQFTVRGVGGDGITDAGLERYLRDAEQLGTPLTEEQLRAGAWWVGGKGGNTVAYAATKADAEAAAKTIYDASKSGGEKAKEPQRPHLDEIERDGLERAIDRDVTAGDFINDFGFRGVEWGNWAAQDERQRIANFAYDALADLARILNLPRRALSLNGTMGMAFGARGGGRFAAHYEPGKLVINMTKLNGAGSLAHEWAHAFDHYIGELDQANAYQGLPRGASGWHHEAQYNGVPIKSHVKDANGKWVPTKQLRLANLRPELAERIDAVMRALFTGQQSKTDMLAEMDMQIERTERYAATETESADLRKMYESEVEKLRAARAKVAADPDDKTYPKGRSQFAAEAQRLSGKSSSGYWLRPTEMFARAFEAYVFDRLVAMGAKSQYLVHGVEADRYASGYKGNPYPTGDERLAINRAFDALVAELKTRETDKGVAVYSRADEARAAANNTGPDSREALRAALDAEFGADVIDTLEKAGLLSVANVPPASMPSDVAGATEGERIRLFAANTPAGSTAVAYHEALHATLRRMIGDAAFDALMQRMPLLAAGNRKWFAEAADRIPADTAKAARNSELASYAVEQYQRAREAMPAGVRKWVQDLIAAIKVGLGKALQAAGVGLKLRVRLLSDAAVLHKLARDGLRTMAREAGQGAMNEAPAFSAKAPPFYSALLRSVRGLGMNAAPAKGWADAIKGLVAKGSVKADEVEWSGVNEWLALQEGKVSRAAVVEFIENNGVRVTETVLGGTRPAFRVYTRSGQFEEAFESREEAEEVAARIGGDIRDGEIARAMTGGDTKYAQYTLPGGANYREVLLTLPLRKSAPVTWGEPQSVERNFWAHGGGRETTQEWIASDGARIERQSKRGYVINSPDVQNSAHPTLDAAKAYYQRAKYETEARYANRRSALGNYQSAHWGQPNILAHIRVNDRTDADGKRVLFVEELQSDWGQDGKKKGFADPAKKRVVVKRSTGDQETVARFATGDEAQEYIDAHPGERLVSWVLPADDGPPAAPFVTNTDKWLALALKRIIKMAVDEGYDKVAFITGEQSAERYDLSKQVRRISWTGDDVADRIVTIAPNAGNDIEFRVLQDGTVVGISRLGRGAGEFQGKHLSDVVGKDAADKIMAERSGSLSGNGLRVGGDGMTAFYDKIVPSVLKDVLRKVGGGQLGAVGIEAREQPGFDITPAMREKAANGLPLFSVAPQTDSAAFRKWFGDSKVVDADGRPLVSRPALVAARKAASLEGGVNGGASNAKPISDLLIGQPFSLQGLGGLEIPAQRKVLDGVLSLGDDLKILRSVVELIPIDVVDILAGKNLSAEELFRDEAVLKKLLSADRNGSVSTAVDIADALVLAVARMAAKGSAVPSNPFVGSKEVNATAGTGDADVFHVGIVNQTTGNNGYFDGANPDIRYSRAAPQSPAGPAPTGLAAAAQRLRNAGGGSRIIGQTARQYTPEQIEAMRNVGFQVEAPTIEDRIKSLWKDAGKKLAQGLVDQFAPVKAISEEAYGLLRLAKGASGAFETLLKGGKLKLSEGVYDFDDTDKGGVIESLLMPLQGEHHDFLRWVAANRAERLASEGKENLFSDDDIDNLKSLSDGTTDFDYTIQHGARAGQVTRDRTLIYEDSLKTFNGFNKNVLDMAEQSGLIDGESRAVWEHEFYVPFYRVADEDDGGVKGMNVRSGAVRQEAFKRLKGGRNELNADLLDNTLLNWAHLLDASAKNRAAKATLEAAEQMGAAISSTESAVRDMGAATQKKNGVVWVMDEGVKRFYLVDDPHLLQALVGLEYAGMRGPMMKAMGAFKHALTVGVTASPFFKIRNLIRDSVQAIGTGPIGYNPAANVAQGWALTDPKSDAYFRLLAGGGTIHFGTMMEGNEAKRVQALVESGVDSATILDGEHKIKAFYRKFIEPGITAYNELGNRGEAINRASLYAQLRAQGVGHAEASLQARDLMDFSMQGSFASVRFLTQVVPFLNARIQGLYKLGRAAKEDPARIGVVLGATTLASLSLLLAFGDDDDWKKREDWDRNNFWWFKFGGAAFRIPKPFEIGAIATLAERGFELAFDKEMTGTRFRGQVLKLLGDNLAMNPVPQLVKPMLDVYANVNSFTGRPIETMSMERLRPQYRFTDRTSMTARAASTAANAVTGLVGVDGPSPVQIDHMLRGYFGWLGTFIVGTADVVARPATGQPSRATPDVWGFATDNMVSDLRDAPSRYVSQMYEQARVIEEAYGTWRALLKSGEGEEAREFFEDNRETILKRRLVERQKSSLTEMNQRIRAIERSNDMTADEKRAAIRLIQSRKDMAARVTAMAR